MLYKPVVKAAIEQDYTNKLISCACDEFMSVMERGGCHSDIKHLVQNNVLLSEHVIGLREIAESYDHFSIFDIGFNPFDIDDVNKYFFGTIYKELGITLEGPIIYWIADVITLLDHTNILQYVDIQLRNLLNAGIGGSEIDED